jgi:hypothetical protein
VRLHAEVGLFGGRLGEGQQCAAQAELLECLRAQAPADAADVLGAAAGGLAQVVELFAQMLRHVVRHRLDLQQHRGQRLTDLVMQLASDSSTLGLLDRERHPRA